MKHLPAIAGALLGALFVLFAVVFFFDLMEQEPPPEGSPPAMFLGAMVPTGYLAFVKVLELVGGVLTAIPATRRIGLLVLGPIIVNILAFHVFLTGGAGLADPPVIAVTVLAVFLVWADRRAFVAFARGG